MSSSSSSSESPLPGVFTRTIPRPAPNGMGTGLFATADIQTGEDALDIKVPFAAILDTPRLEDTCSGCFGKRHLEDMQPTLRACTGCQTVRYCDKTCQSKDWKQAHSLECAIYKELSPNVLPNNARALLRMVLRMHRRKYDPRELDLFSNLETHMRDIRDRSRIQWDRINLTAAAIRTYSRIDDSTSEEMIAGYAAKLDLNSFNLTTALYDRIGLYLHPYAALINHSCDYNAVVGFDGDELFVKAIRPIKKDEQIFISYIDTTNPVTKRRQELSERYFFRCLCLKCQRELEADNDGDDKHRSSEAGKSYNSLQDDLISSLISSGQFESAFIKAAARHLHIDPVVYPHEAHPIRQIHAWALAKLAIHLSQEGSNSSSIGDNKFEYTSAAAAASEDTAPTISLRDANINYGYIIWSTLYRMVRKEGQSCSVPSLKGIIRRAFNEVDGEFMAHGIDPRRMTGEIAAEWKKLDALASTRM